MPQDYRVIGALWRWVDLAADAFRTEVMLHALAVLPRAASPLPEGPAATCPPLRFGPVDFH